MRRKYFSKCLGCKLQTTSNYCFASKDLLPSLNHMLLIGPVTLRKSSIQLILYPLGICGFEIPLLLCHFIWKDKIFFVFPDPPFFDCFYCMWTSAQEVSLQDDFRSLLYGALYLWFSPYFPQMVKRLKTSFTLVKLGRSL